MPSPFDNTLRKYQFTFKPVVDFDPVQDQLLHLDFTERNKGLTADIIDDTNRFAAYIDHQVKAAGCRYGIGGYDENRTVYSRSSHFSGQPGEEPRRLHLGIDVWAPAGTPVYAFMGGMVHSYAFNDLFGDYGATLVLLHQLDGIPFYTLYGHVSLADIQKVQAGQYVSVGQEIAHFGEPAENGHWPPHLHFQIILDMELKEGDYPGVCKYSERDKYLANCPDPDLILQMMRYAK
ncbi:peptidoglycan DD-metalloendopeptidase family protein [Paraflavitalea pollutisoli]|uniref:peptidoglycan DD-metalloendopeptidase family protein n=1 Tax=Paraflavitalea pollutisoli TaxID=3034143 RepID=UPI0023ECD1D2|nr:peptidoglycan DD-metalloendopeptidase family protein [Paraflavitalea sp. H1-2-19X]